jgi:hypothetical protein
MGGRLLLERASRSLVPMEEAEKGVARPSSGHRHWRRKGFAR